MRLFDFIKNFFRESRKCAFCGRKVYLAELPKNKRSYSVKSINILKKFPDAAYKCSFCNWLHCSDCIIKINSNTLQCSICGRRCIEFVRY